MQKPKIKQNIINQNIMTDKEKNGNNKKITNIEYINIIIMSKKEILQDYLSK